MAKKIMFSDKYGLTDAVLRGRKTQTRRVYKTPRNSYGGLEVENSCIITFDANGREIVTSPKYKVGEVVAVAQSYASIIDELENPKNYYNMEHWESDAPKRAHYAEFLHHPGMTNKMFVSADEMPHQIRITDVRVERLQDISEQDIFAEGIEKTENGYCAIACMPNSPTFFNPRFAYAWLIDKISGKGVWDSNPYVFAYEFELVK